MNDKCESCGEHPEECHCDKEDDLENQEVWVKVFFNGYFPTLKKQSLAVHIRVENPNFGEKDRFKGTTKILPPIHADENGDVDLTPLLNTFNFIAKENPNCPVKVYATGFMRQLEFNKDLLKLPIPESINNLFLI